MLLRYGMLRNIGEAVRVGREGIENVIAFQSEAGTWKEAGTMVVKYSEVTFACHFIV